MPRRPSVDVLERDARASDLYRRGLSYRQIAAEVGFKSPQSVGDAIRRHARTMASDALGGPDAVQMMLDRLQDYRRAAWRVLTTRHYVASVQSGKIVTGPDGQPLIDDDPVLRALDRLLRFDQEESRLRDLYPAVKHEVRNIDAIDARLLDLAGEMGRVDPGAAAGVRREA